MDKKTQLTTERVREVGHVLEAGMTQNQEFSGKMCLKK